MEKYYKLLAALMSSLILLAFTGCSESTSTVNPTIVTFELTKSLDNNGVMYVDTYVSGSYNQNVTVVFRSGNRDLLSVDLSPQNPEKLNFEVLDGFQKLNVYIVSLVPPTNFVPGTIHIEADYTDFDGRDSYIFNGLVAAWFLN